MNKKKSIFIFIILLGAFLRFYNLNSVPPSASLDEASIGYNAYSILKTGADEYGTKFPILLRAYDDWRPALYVYLVIPFIKIFGLSAFSIRLPSIILSILTIIATYFLVKAIFQKSEFKSIQSRVNENHLALLTSFLLTVSPWHIYISRLGHEANAGFAFFIFGLLFFATKRIYLSLIFFVLSFISYQSEKIFIPALLLGIFFIYYKELLAMKKKIAIALIFISILLIPFLKESFSSSALLRYQGTSIFNAEVQRFEEQKTKLAKAVKEKNILGRVIYNKELLTARIFIEGYASHVNPLWLFTNPTTYAHKVPGLGLLYLWESPYILLGIIILIREQINPKTKKLIFLWFLAAPLAAAFTTDVPHALRSYTFLPTWQIFSALGILFMFNALKSVQAQKVLAFALGGAVFISFLYFYRQYFFVFPNLESASFQYGLSKAVPFVLQNEQSYSKIVFSNEKKLAQSYMFFLFYSKYDPAFYQKQGGTKSGGFSQVHKIGKYEFRPIDYFKEEKKTLLIGNILDFPQSAYPLQTVTNLDGKEDIKILER